MGLKISVKEVGGAERDAAVASGRAAAADGSGQAKFWLVGKASVRTDAREAVASESGVAKAGFFGVEAKAYWESMGAVPLGFAAFGVAALTLKMLKVKTGQWKAGDGGVNRATTHASIVTNEAEAKELHVFKCEGCGYEMYPARGREFKHFGDKFKCPLCGTGKEGFWDLNDENDSRNWEDEGDEGGDGDDGDGGVVQGVGREEGVEEKE